MRIIRSTVLHLLHPREARLVLESAPRTLTGLPIDTLRCRAQQARSLCTQYRHMADARRRALSAGCNRRPGPSLQAVEDSERRAALLEVAAGRYERAVERREVHPTPRTAPRGVTTLVALTGGRALPRVHAGAPEVRVVPLSSLPARGRPPRAGGGRQRGTPRPS